MRSIAILHDTPEDCRDLLEDRFPALAFHYATRSEEIVPVLEAHDPEAVLSIKHPGFPGPTHRPSVLHPSVRWVHVGGSGYDHMTPWDPDRVTVTNSAGVLSPYLAETVVGAILTINAGFLHYVERRRERRWAPRPFVPLSEQTLLVVGLGEIGGRVATLAKALGMRVLAVRRRRTPHPAVDELFAPSELHAVLGRADYVSLHVRADDETRHLIDTPALAAMKQGAVLLNTSRGFVVEEAALVSALESGDLAGAYLDVFETEPLPESSPLWSFENVLLTPHASDNIHAWPRKFIRLFGDNLERWLAGEALVNVVGP